jgi:subtilisin family serine protease
VDRRLFDVTLLVESGYDDAHRSNLPLIVTYPRTNAARALPRVVPGTVAGRDLPSVNGLALSSPKAQVSQVWNTIVAGPGGSPFAAVNEPIGKVWLDALHHPVLDHSVPQIGAPSAWELGYEGDGVVVAVLDTGVDDAHPDLIDTVVVSENFTVDPDGDQVGHGTHVASIIAGSGAASDGLYRGVAPGVSLLSGKVCEGFGCPESSMIAGMQWAAAEEGAQVINMSISGSDTPGLDPLEEAVETLSSQYGALFVIAAGNDGGFLPVGTAGSTAAALTVGAVDRDDNVAYFSSRGLTVDGALKPDITGPGVDIVAARAAGSELGLLVGEDYVTVSGTSMATPHVAGAAALVMQQHPSWRGTDVKAALMGSAAFNPAYTTVDQGAGRVDVAAAINTSFLANASSLSLGIARWPHEDDEPTVRTITYRNLGPAAELVIELDIVGPDGSRPPADMFSITPSTISLPEGGTASVRVTANTAVAAPDGFYNGRVLASDGAGRSLAIPLALTREVESYNLTLQHLDRQGQPTALWFDNLLPYFGAIGLPWVDPPSTVPGDVVLRLAKGKYAYESYIYSNVEPYDYIRIVAPNQLIDADKVLVLDGSATIPVTLVAPKEGAENLGTYEAWGAPAEQAFLGSGLATFTLTDVAFYRGEIAPPEPTLVSTISTDWRDTASSPQDYYAGAWKEQGRMPPSTLEIDQGQAAVVHASYAAPLTSVAIFNEISAAAFAVPELGWASFVYDYELPLARTERYYSPDPTMQWINELWMHDAEFSQGMIMGWVPYSYAAGATYTSRWNEPVFSPSVPDQTSIFEWAVRDGDQLVFQPSRYGDSDNHGGFIGSTGSTVLYRDGEVVGRFESGDGGLFDVPPEPASYRLEIDHHQTVFELTPDQQIAWTFQSGHAEDGSPERIPLLVVRFTPELDDRGRAPSDTHFCLPLYVDQFDREAPPRVSTPSVEASYDDGATWAAARVVPNGSGWNAFLDHPKRAQYVSLRTSTHDANGNAVQQTLIRAYGLKKRR